MKSLFFGIEFPIEAQWAYAPPSGHLLKLSPHGNSPAQTRAGGGIMVDVILDLFGAALFVGQAVAFLFSGGDWADPASSDRSTRSEMGARRL